MGTCMLVLDDISRDSDVINSPNNIFLGGRGRGHVRGRGKGILNIILNYNLVDIGGPGRDRDGFNSIYSPETLNNNSNDIAGVTGQFS